MVSSLGLLFNVSFTLLDASSSQSQVFHFQEVLDKANYTCYHVTVMKFESLDLVLMASRFLTQTERSNWIVYSVLQNRDLYIIISKPPDIILKRTKHIKYIKSIFIARPSPFTSGRILKSYSDVPTPRVLTD